MQLVAIKVNYKKLYATKMSCFKLQINGRPTAHHKYIIHTCFEVV